MRTAAVLLAISAAAGCAALGDVTPIGDGSYMAAVHSNDVNARVEQEKAKAEERARAFCAEKQASVQVIRLVADAPPAGQPPSAEIDFRCAAK